MLYYLTTCTFDVCLLASLVFRVESKIMDDYVLMKQMMSKPPIDKMLSPHVNIT